LIRKNYSLEPSAERASRDRGVSVAPASGVSKARGRRSARPLAGNRAPPSEEDCTCS